MLLFGVAFAVAAWLLASLGSDYLSDARVRKACLYALERGPCSVPELHARMVALGDSCHILDVYVAVHDLVEEGTVEAVVGPATPERGGRPSYSYRLR